MREASLQLPPTTQQSRPKRVKTEHHTSSEPYPTTRHHATLNHHDTSSVRPNYGLTDEQAEKLDRIFQTAGGRAEFLGHIFESAGGDARNVDLMAFARLWPEQERTFSELTTRDADLLCKGVQDHININHELLVKKVPDSSIPEHFLPVLRMCRQVASRSTAMGIRGIIDIFVNVAVYIARSVFDEPRLVVDHEVEMQPLKVPMVGIVGGPLDYVTFRVPGSYPMSNGLGILY
jgi:hypothetical protein